MAAAGIGRKASPPRRTPRTTCAFAKAIHAWAARCITCNATMLCSYIRFIMPSEGLRLSDGYPDTPTPPDEHCQDLRRTQRSVLRNTSPMNAERLLQLA